MTAKAEIRVNAELRSEQINLDNRLWVAHYSVSFYNPLKRGKCYIIKLILLDYNRNKSRFFPNIHLNDKN